MTPQDRSLKHHDIYRKRVRTWRKVKNVKVEIGGECLGWVYTLYVSRGSCRGHLTVSPVGWWLHFLFESVRDPPSIQVAFGPSSTCAVGKVFVSCPRILPFTSETWICISQPTDLDIITSEREITLVEQLALLAICCTSARFMAVCGPEIQSIPPPSPGSKLVYSSFCVSFRIFF